MTFSNGASLPTGFEYRPGFMAMRTSTADQLAATLALEQRAVTMFGRSVPEPRLTAWYGDAAYTYSGIVHAPRAMPDWLARTKAEVERAAGATFNSVLANYYRDGRDSVSWHSDDEPELRAQPTIASLSFGAPRAFKVRSKVVSSSGARAVWSLVLEHGDLLVMRGDSQRDYQHAVPKTAAKWVRPQRLNLTFRQVG